MAFGDSFIHRFSWKATGLDAIDDTSATLVTGMGEIRESLTREFGYRKFHVIRPTSGAPTVGQVVAQEEQQAAAASATSGSTTTLTDTGIGFTADEFGGLNGPNYVLIVDDAGAAGAAPEGEVSRITDNTTDTLTFGALTAAVAASDTYVIIRPYVAVDGGATTTAGNCLGVIMATSVTNDNWGFAQTHGFNTGVSVPATDAVTAGGAIMVPVASAAADSIADGTSTGPMQGIGVFLGDDRAADTVRNFWPGFISLPR